MGLGAPHNFFGYTVTGDTIVSVTHNLQGSFEGIDNFRFGVAGSLEVVPEPSTLLMAFSACRPARLRPASNASRVVKPTGGRQCQ